MDRLHKNSAKAIGARIMKRVKGRWPGNADIFAAMVGPWANGYPSDGLGEMTDTHGPYFNLPLLWSDMIFTTSPKQIQIVLATEFQNFEKGERFQNSMKSVLGLGVFNADGTSLPKFHRSMTRPFFTRDRIIHFDLYDRHAETAISQMKQRLRSGYPVDFQDLTYRFTLDSATEFLFGSCVNTLTAALPYPQSISIVPAEANDARSLEANEFSEAFFEAQEILSSRLRKGWIWPLFEIRKDKTEAPMKVVRGFVEPIIQAALKRKESSDSVNEKPEPAAVGDDETLLDHLVSITSDPAVIRDETLNILIAGRDTTAATLTFLVYFLSMYPDVCTRLREEILTRVGTTRAPTFEDIKEMKYLGAVINETLRLYPAVPFNVRESISATTFPSEDPSEKPLYIPANTKVSYSVFIMHRRKDLWGPDAEEFDPDRFLDHRLKQYLIPNPFIFLPFNAGPRICLGQQFAYNEISFMAVRLLQNFTSFEFDQDALLNEFRPPADWAKCKGRKAVDKFWPRYTLTLYSAGGMWIKATETDSLNLAQV
ncbi:cytochrome P450 monooxygenase pc-3 [Guyanagaster necrorhizus]|uniref:Cytochrome P450 monooxygenase pc-3 n=1 Tax=Guyanagaster necrorhizus TaxID=856835 RepID=A0A9P7VM65_9AGAR|nr:cytochrome P450 monooxygenase pc-3 [Guyanagaster necrorhizus MCA 3950]KAG7443776.1 cytochrome P450 monooxygenase pc-3 [Guyanagaster necrorhizus MCA 3950]